MAYQSVIAYVIFTFICGAFCVKNPDELLSTPVLIAKYGYPAEIHTVTTADGYILTLHRIPHSPKSPSSRNKPAFFVQHGLLCSSADWIMLGPEKSLGYQLADTGFDVWLGNARGNTYSKNHTTLSVSDYQFWDFSWHEMGVYDLPAAFDYVLGLTGQKKLSYVGHSMGTTMFYVCMSMKPEYNEKIKIMASLAPIAYLGHASNVLEKLVGSYITGTQTILPVLLAHTPAGTSVKTLLHYAQGIGLLFNEFKQFDYHLLNPIVYGSLIPPSYNVKGITAPIYLMYADNDPLGDPIDVFKLYDTLPNVRGLSRVALRTFNHMDFLWGKDIKPLVNEQVIQVLLANQSD